MAQLRQIPFFSAIPAEFPGGSPMRAMMGLPPHPDIVRIHRRRCESVGGVGQLDRSGVRRNPNIECLGGRILPI
jgi:hypothetical protein